MAVRATVDAALSLRGAVLGRVVAAASATNRDDPFAIACEVARFEFLATSGFLSKLLHRESGAAYSHAVQDGVVRPLRGAELDDHMCSLLSRAAFIDRLDPVGDNKVVALPVVFCL